MQKYTAISDLDVTPAPKGWHKALINAEAFQSLHAGNLEHPINFPGKLIALYGIPSRLETFSTLLFRLLFSGFKSIANIICSQLKTAAVFSYARQRYIAGNQRPTM